ncbi:methyltransferase domain-containing protein [Pseudonocardia sp. TRM90224]|uniref:methyltransferase domain-containing protein n=1 Tax=Pseudonocardia sp. TRM90224 TaxID=2812678 RepID=UPI001E5B607C|nr:methyltransferase domain-containing protein [Pseudonocardia sp. TRM90224]
MPDIGPFLVSARSFDEYRAMFALTDADLTGRVLDCPGGAAAFVAGAGERGIDAVAVDPVYAGDRSGLGEQAVADAGRGNRFMLDHAHRFVWTWFRDPDDHRRRREEAATAFAADLRARPERYVAGALPALPFPDRAFDLVLSSHLLFTYGERFDDEFHLAALCELVRVSRVEVRLFPLLGHVDGEPHPGLDALLGRLAERGIRSDVRRVEYEFQRGGDEMLVLTRP